MSGDHEAATMSPKEKFSGTPPLEIAMIPRKSNHIVPAMRNPDIHVGPGRYLRKDMRRSNQLIVFSSEFFQAKLTHLTLFVIAAATRRNCSIALF